MSTIACHLGSSLHRIITYFAVLQGLRGSLGTAPLNINEVRAVLRLLRYTCDATDPDLGRSMQRARASGDIAVPAADSRLVPTAVCVHALSCPLQLLRR